ncbi:heterokaryon incompatibility protein-domain-containing protein [Clohesyomyces aquaticus]|uniref:Heterokaryon incompatibility protein-domain-containing protein n=1 Tax=Clohesyomyces aquaticus TaxID=1231657 RepID=A0A1Y1YN29_9PLEO|nr:heterokaryon incompatibility protein-domain-containing protein [Clohesyomyces aquaticus]
MASFILVLGGRLSEISSYWLQLCASLLKPKNKFPTRILKLDRTNGVYCPQIVVAKEWVPYVALSYCWGGDQRHKTTGQGLRETGGQGNFLELPSTIQDTVRVTYSLGFDYIWVDSICTVQDNERDKMHEIGRMPVVYSQASLTIVVSGATSAHDGFLDQRDHYTLGGVINLNLQLPDGSNCKNESLVPLARYNIRFDVPGLDSRWRTLVEEYSMRNLTEPSDRPLAISGIATKLHTLLQTNYVASRSISVPPDIYLAGHWFSSHPADLMWSAHHGNSRPRKYQGPSWSWTAITGSLDFDWAEIEFEANIELDLIGHQITVQDETAPFGAVTEGILTVRACLRNALVLFWSHQDVDDIKVNVETGYYDGNVLPVWDAAESDFDSGTKYPVHMLPIYTSGDFLSEGVYENQGILLWQVVASPKTECLIHKEHWHGSEVVAECSAGSVNPLPGGAFNTFQNQKFELKLKLRQRVTIPYD